MKGAYTCFHYDVIGGGIVHTECQIKMRACTLLVCSHITNTSSGKWHAKKEYFACRQIRTQNKSYATPYILHSCRKCIPIEHSNNDHYGSCVHHNSKQQYQGYIG